MFAFFESPAHESYIVLCKHKEKTEMAHLSNISDNYLLYIYGISGLTFRCSVN